MTLEWQSVIKFNNCFIWKRCIDLIDTIESLESKVVNYKKVLYAFTNRTNLDPKFYWNSLQGYNEIHVEDNIVKHPSVHLTSEQVNYYFDIILFYRV